MNSLKDSEKTNKYIYELKNYTFNFVKGEYEQETKYFKTKNSLINYLETHEEITFFLINSLITED